MKKLLAIILSVCMTLAACGAAFAAEKKGESKASETVEKLGGKLSDYVDDETLSAILSTLNRLAELSAADPTADYSGDYDFAEYLYLLGYGDVLESGKYTEGVMDYLKELFADSEKYAEGALTEEAFLDLINRGSGKTDNLLELDKDELLKADEDDLFTIDDIKYIFKELGVEEELTDEEYENALFALLFVMRMIEIYYWESIDEISPLEVLYTLYVISELYDAGELDDVDVEEIIALLGLEDAVEIVEAAEVAAMVYSDDDDASMTEAEIIALLNSLGLTGDLYDGFVSTYGLAVLLGMSEEEIQSVIQQFIESQSSSEPEAETEDDDDPSGDVPGGDVPSEDEPSERPRYATVIYDNDLPWDIECTERNAVNRGEDEKIFLHNNNRNNKTALCQFYVNGVLKDTKSIAAGDKAAFILVVPEDVDSITVGFKGSFQ